MTHPMTDERLAELRGGFARGRISLASAPPSLTEEVVVTIKDVRALLARLDAAEAQVHIARRESEILLEALAALTEEQLAAIPEGRLLLALKAMTAADNEKDYYTVLDGQNIKLTAAAELIREVAKVADDIEDARLLDGSTLDKCRSYLR